MQIGSDPPSGSSPEDPARWYATHRDAFLEFCATISEEPPIAWWRFEKRIPLRLRGLPPGASAADYQRLRAERRAWLDKHPMKENR